MTLPHLTAHLTTGPTRQTRLYLSRGNRPHGNPATAAGYRALPVVEDGDRWHFHLQGEDGSRAGAITLKSGLAGRMELYNLYVEPEHRGQRLSRQLVALAAEKARQLGGTRLWLEARPDPDETLSPERLYRIYETMGFQRTQNRDGRQEMEAPL